MACSCHSEFWHGICHMRVVPYSLSLHFVSVEIGLFECQCFAPMWYRARRVCSSMICEFETSTICSRENESVFSSASAVELHMFKKEKRKFEKVFSRLSKLCTSCAINGTGRPRSVSRFGREAQPEGPPEAILVAQPDSPSEHERKIHRLTHLPFAPW